MRSGNEHQRLHLYPSQIKIVEEPWSQAYLQYREDVKNNQGGLKSQRKAVKQVVHYANISNPARCFVRLCKLHIQKCFPDSSPGAFYLQSLSRPKDNIWFSKVPCGHNTLQNIVPQLMKKAGFTGYFTNHSLRATTATQLFDAGVDEQLIMS